MSDVDDMSYYEDEDNYYDEPTDFQFPGYKLKDDFKMPKKILSKRKKVINPAKPTLYKVGKHLIDPTDVACVTNVRDNLYLIKLKSDPSPQYGTWVEGDEISNLLECFNIVVKD